MGRLPAIDTSLPQRVEPTTDNMEQADEASTTGPDHGDKPNRVGSILVEPPLESRGLDSMATNRTASDRRWWNRR